MPPIIEAESVPLSPATAAMADDASQEKPGSMQKRD